MEDPDPGAAPPISGGAADAAQADHGPQRWTGGTRHGPTPARSADSGSSPHKPVARRRRRKRGRKVYVRDATEAPAHVVEPVADRPPSPVAATQVAGPWGVVPASPTTAINSAPNTRTTGSGGSADGFAQRAAIERFGPQAYAALDLGTNNCRLLVAVATRPGQFRVVDAYSRIVRLGEGLSATGRLGEAPMARAIEALAVCADKLASRQVRLSRLIATEACRAATNGSEFLARVRDRTGLELEIIDRETEARLAVSGCGSLIEAETEAVVLFDIGGGSSEIALIDMSRGRTQRLASHIASWTSLPVGVVSLAERHGGRHVTRETFEDMVADVMAMLAVFEGRGALGALAAGPSFHLLGTSGTVTTLAGVHLGLERYDRRKVDGLWMDSADVDRMTETLLSWDFDRRVANACIGADRADLVLAGCAILEAIRRVWPSQRLRVADRGLREGILIDLMAADGAWRRRRWRNGR